MTSSWFSGRCILRLGGWSSRAMCCLGLVAVAMAGAALGAESGFPFDSELTLDARPMKGSKRVPMIEVGPDGRAAIDLWCNSVEGQIVVVESTVSVMTGKMTDRQCDPARMRGDEELLAALQQATSWAREREVITLRGGKTLRFRPPSN
jgi:heat shock protein HslJ